VNIQNYTVILPVVLYGLEAWSLTLRQEHRLRVFKKRVLKKIFGSKRDEVTGGWRKLHNEELYDLYSFACACALKHISVFHCIHPLPKVEMRYEYSHKQISVSQSPYRWR
jgi:hypothetical protein